MNHLIYLNPENGATSYIPWAHVASVIVIDDVVIRVVTSAREVYTTEYATRGEQRIAMEHLLKGWEANETYYFGLPITTESGDPIPPDPLDSMVTRHVSLAFVGDNDHGDASPTPEDAHEDAPEETPAALDPEDIDNDEPTSAELDDEIGEFDDPEYLALQAEIEAEGEVVEFTTSDAFEEGEQA